VTEPPEALPVHRYEDVCGGEEGALWEWMRAIVTHGATLLRGVPTTEGAVRQVAELLGPVQTQIYGDVFDVRHEPGAINLAYTSEAIGPHMDLMYYESPPGLQLLHCLRFDADVRGGQSLLIDAFHVAAQLRAKQPEAFEALTRLPATFIKDHSARPEPVLMSYQRPHITVDTKGGRVIGVFWSPPFEGPLQLPAHDVAEYYAAYRALSNAIDEARVWQLRMEPGDMLVFNNRRMLHGRLGFDSTSGGSRHLRGCYVNIDEFANRFNLMDRRFGGAADAVRQPLGNQDHALRAVGLPARCHESGGGSH